MISSKIITPENVCLLVNISIEANSVEQSDLDLHYFWKRLQIFQQTTKNTTFYDMRFKG